MRPIVRSEIRSREEYERTRDEFRRGVMVRKARRRVLLGEHCSIHFEDRETMLYQVHEMLRVEGSWSRPGAVEDELEAYNPLIPRAGQLSATAMFEYETPEERATILPRLVGIDRHLHMQIGDRPPIRGVFDGNQIDERKISSVQYVTWTLDPATRARLKEEGTVVRIVVDHPCYRAQAVLSEETRRAIMNDPDEETP